MAGVDEATKIVHGSQPTQHRGDDPNLHHNPGGGTAEFSHGVNANPLGAKAEFSHGVVDTNPTGDRAEMAGIVINQPRGSSAPISPGVNANPAGATSGSVGPNTVNSNPR
jgi:hypothetical protein